jgi:hypothetical protein
MRYMKYLGILIILLIAIAGSGCSEQGGGLNLPGGSKTPTPTVTPVPTPAYGNLVITTKPVGATVYIEGVYSGVAPINFSNMPNGKYNVSLQMDQFATNNFTAEVKGGQTTTVSKSLSEAKPKMEFALTDASVQEIPPCIWTFIGTLTNTGTETLRDAIFTLEMKPRNSAYKTVTKSMEMGDISPGNSRPFGMQITVLCEGDYQAILRWEGEEWNNPNIVSDDKVLKGSKNL